jgi:hypothetical protein
MGMRASKRGQTGAAGVSAVSGAFERIGWGVVENSRHDVGTDLFVMARDLRLWDLGLVVGVQVKSGPTRFQQKKRDATGEVVGWWFSDRNRNHVDAWISHGLPHLLVLHDFATQGCYWVHITADAVVSTGKGVKILVLRAHTIDDAHRDALMQIAATLRPPMAWEGTAWTGAANLPPCDLLRYALIVPRLVAPHPNQGLQAILSPEQTVALLTQVRMSHLARYSHQHPSLPSLEEASTSPTWIWRLAGALAHRLTSGETSGLTPMVRDAPDSKSRAAAAAIAAAGLLEHARVDEAITVLEAVLARDDTEPVDHAWLRVQHARACAEVGRVEEARATALEVQAIRVTHPADVTATAIAGVAGDLLYRTSAWTTRNVADVITGADTTAAWWRSELTSDGLFAVAERTFRSWARDTSTIWAAEDRANDRLFAASLTANHLGDHQQWRSLTALRGRDALLRLDRNSNAEAARKGLAMLRVAGDRTALELAIGRVDTDGPAEAITLATAEIDLATSTQTTGPTNLTLLERGGDLADVDTADRSVIWLLDTLIDPAAFIGRTTPSYWLPQYILKALAGVVPAASLLSQRAVAERLAALADIQDQGLATAWADVAGALPSAAWEDETARQAVNNAAGHDRALRWRLVEVVARFDLAVRQELIDAARDGSMDALAALGDVSALPDDIVSDTINRLIGQLNDHVSQAHQGTFTQTVFDPGHTMAILNIWHPQLAEWDALCRLLADRSVSGAHKQGALRVLATSVDRLPDDVRQRLEPISLDIASQPGRADAFIAKADATAAASELAAALGPDRGPDQLLDLMGGNGLHRQSAARAARRLGRPEDVGVLIALAADPDPAVRATAAAALAHLVATHLDGTIALAALRRCLRDPGTSVAVSIAAALASEATRSTAADAVLVELRSHRSAAVRRLVSDASR